MSEPIGHAMSSKTHDVMCSSSQRGDESCELKRSMATSSADGSRGHWITPTGILMEGPTQGVSRRDAAGVSLNRLSFGISTEHGRQSLPSLGVGQSEPSKVLIQVQDDLQRIATTSMRRCDVLFLDGGDNLGDTGVGLFGFGTAREGQHVLEDFVGSKRKAKLGR